MGIEWVGYHNKAMQGYVQKTLLQKERIKSNKDVSYRATEYRKLLDNLIKIVDYHTNSIESHLPNLPTIQAKIRQKQIENDALIIKTGDKINGA